MKTVLITGANKSIGFETARQLAKAGYYVYLGSRDIENGEQAVAKLKAEGLDNIEAIQIDISNPASVKQAREEIGKKLNSLDVLINNAGISGGFPQPPSSLDTTTIKKVFDTNFFGTIEVTQVFLDLLKKSDSPRIVNVTSGLASLTLHSDPSWKYYNFKGGAYGPSKTALNAYTIALAFELKDTAFKINVVDPGFTATDFNQHRGTGNVNDAAAIIVKYATIGADGPTGKYFSNDMDTVDKESPW
ncbi:SDR family oxidoreductase [Mucilaginibacter sp.]|uniref:SDR family oxidoreductase n=1 Tax=Mucilaginibacter sp. TaxID=1882438 RepID=UPI00260748D4|nr:SDR family oxidoreductase [Mucilaginibacter sp.]MDB4925228.1 family oxidoreductase [Mucilaginibacter sp.]